MVDFFGASWEQLGGPEDETRKRRGGSKCQRPAVQQSQQPFDSVAMLLAGGRRYPLYYAPMAGLWRSVTAVFEAGGDGAIALLLHQTPE